MTADLVRQMTNLLAKLDRPGNFCASGFRVCPMPGIEVDEVGPVALPVLPYQAAQLIAAATPAPYGRGADTLVDGNVRKTWQIDGERVRVTDALWATTLDEIVTEVARQLGASEVGAELYKLLVYDPGSFFVPHRDTEKVPGMFATLVVCLPSRHEGGDLVIRHQDAEANVDLRNADVTRVTYAAFYADCLHEIRPITSGHRVCLVYNLVRKGKALVAPDHRAPIAKARDLLQRWAGSEDGPVKLLAVLDHHYTPDGLCFAGLKGRDAAVGQVLVPAAQHSACHAHLAMVSIHEEGSAEPLEYGSRYRRRHRRDDDDDGDFEVVEVLERRQVVEDWRTPDDSVPELTPIPWDEEEVCPEGALDELTPDEQYFTEATGNEGGSFERTYRRAAIVLWPDNRRLALIAQAGVELALPMLTEIPEDDARTLAAMVVAAWPPRLARADAGGVERARLLAALARLGDSDLVARLFDAVILDAGYSGDENTALLACWERLDRAVLAPRLCLLLARHLDQHTAACATLLDLLIPGPTDDVDQRAIAEATAENLPREPKRSWWQTDVATTTLARILAVLGRAGGAELEDRAAKHVLSQPGRYPLDAVVVPTAALRVGPSRLLREAALAHLTARIALPLAAPPDLAREANQRCRCANCASFTEFMLSGDRPRWTLKAAEHHRQHLQGQALGLDVDFATVRGGSPHTLVATKNQRSYERRKAQRAEDLESLGKLSGGRSP